MMRGGRSVNSMLQSAMTTGADDTQSLARQTLGHLGMLGVLVGVLWLSEALDVALRWISDWQLDVYGIRPRRLGGLPGIVLAPLLHADFAHLAANTVPLAVLGGLVLVEGAARFWQTTLIIVIVGGLPVWLFGRSDAVYIGASGLAFGYLGYVLMRAWVSRKAAWIIVALGASAVYGGLLLGFLRWVPGVSWLGHVSGFAAGILAAALLHRRERVVPPWS